MEYSVGEVKDQPIKIVVPGQLLSTPGQ